MHALTASTWLREIAPTFRKLFRTTDPFDEPLAPEVEARALLFPVGYLLDREQLAAVLAAARSVGDDTFCVSVTEHTREDGNANNGHWKLAYWEVEEYLALSKVGVLENAVYSPQGTWGILLSQEQHGVVGGTEVFVGQLRATFPGFQRSVEAFLAFWRENERRHRANLEWVPRLLAHVYGKGGPPTP
jgi:hypothetical protein